MAGPSDDARERGIADAETIARARADDTDALADLWAIYQPQVLALLRARGASSVDDIASQVWLEVGRSIERFEGDGEAFRRWIFTIAGRRVIDERRRDRRRREVSVESMSHVPERDHTDERWSASMDSARAILSTLSPVVAEVIMLRIVYDLSVSRVAEATGKSESHVRVLTHRGLEALREQAATGDDPWSDALREIVDATPDEPGADHGELVEVELDAALIAQYV